VKHGPDRLTWVGHSTVLLELDGVRLLTDPILRDRVLHLRRSAPVPPETVRSVDAVLVSHAHWDHLDVRSLERLGRGTLVVCPRGTGRLIRRRRFERVVEVDVGEEVAVDSLAVKATRAEHDGGRGPLGVQAPALGYIVTGSQRVYFAGDTDLFEGMAAFAPLDLALLPVAGWGPTLGPGHLGPESAAEALRLLRPSVAVPIHWGTLAPIGMRSGDRTPADEFARLASERAPEVRVRILPPGGTLEL
jgi:L-ascorbate metabolism protein UlaG (beta-lactamase superfamily)